jgi:hypothetical protein
MISCVVFSLSCDARPCWRGRRRARNRLFLLASIAWLRAPILTLLSTLTFVQWAGPQSGLNTSKRTWSRSNFLALSGRYPELVGATKLDRQAYHGLLVVPIIAALSPASSTFYRRLLSGHRPTQGYRHLALPSRPCSTADLDSAFGGRPARRLSVMGLSKLFSSCCGGKLPKAAVLAVDSTDISAHRTLKG